MPGIGATVAPGASFVSGSGKRGTTWSVTEPRRRVHLDQFAVHRNGKRRAHTIQVQTPGRREAAAGSYSTSTSSSPNRYFAFGRCERTFRQPNGRWPTRRVAA